MTFEELFLKSAQAYFKEEGNWDEYEKVAPRKYGKDFFDKMEKQYSSDGEVEEIEDGSD